MNSLLQRIVAWFVILVLVGQSIGCAVPFEPFEALDTVEHGESAVSGTHWEASVLTSEAEIFGAGSSQEVMDRASRSEPTFYLGISQLQQNEQGNLRLMDVAWWPGFEPIKVPWRPIERGYGFTGIDTAQPHLPTAYQAPTSGVERTYPSLEALEQDIEEDRSKLEQNLNSVVGSGEQGRFAVEQAIKSAIGDYNKAASDVMKALPTSVSGKLDGTSDEAVVSDLRLSLNLQWEQLQGNNGTSHSIPRMIARQTLSSAENLATQGLEQEARVAINSVRTMNYVLIKPENIPSEGSQAGNVFSGGVELLDRANQLDSYGLPGLGKTLRNEALDVVSRFLVGFASEISESVDSIKNGLAVMGYRMGFEDGKTVIEETTLDEKAEALGELVGGGTKWVVGTVAAKKAIDVLAGGNHALRDATNKLLQQAMETGKRLPGAARAVVSSEVIRSFGTRLAAAGAAAGPAAFALAGALVLAGDSRHVQDEILRKVPELPATPGICPADGKQRWSVPMDLVLPDGRLRIETRWHVDPTRNAPELREVRLRN